MKDKNEEKLKKIYISQWFDCDILSSLVFRLICVEPDRNPHFEFALFAGRQSPIIFDMLQQLYREDFVIGIRKHDLWIIETAKAIEREV